MSRREKVLYKNRNRLCFRRNVVTLFITPSRDQSSRCMSVCRLNDFGRNGSKYLIFGKKVLLYVHDKLYTEMRWLFGKDLSQIRKKKVIDNDGLFEGS